MVPHQWINRVTSNQLPSTQETTTTMRAVASTSESHWRREAGKSCPIKGSFYLSSVTCKLHLQMSTSPAGDLCTAKRVIGAVQCQLDTAASLASREWHGQFGRVKGPTKNVRSTEHRNEWRCPYKSVTGSNFFALAVGAVDPVPSFIMLTLDAIWRGRKVYQSILLAQAIDSLVARVPLSLH